MFCDLKKFNCIRRSTTIQLVNQYEERMIVVFLGESCRSILKRVFEINKRLLNFIKLFKVIFGVRRNLFSDGLL